jgi:guanylate kinase
MNARRLLIVLSSPSGGGKTTICDQLLRQDRKLTRSISATTRAPRGREREGRDYYFITEQAFDRQARQGKFLEWARVHGQRYGTLKSEVRKKQAVGKDVVLVIDVQGGLAVKQSHPEAVLVFVQPPSLKVLEQRLRGRGTDSEETVRQRLRNAAGEIRLAAAYDYVVTNRILEEAIRDIRAVVTAERLRVVPGRRVKEIKTTAKAMHLS